MNQASDLTQVKVGQPLRNCEVVLVGKKSNTTKNGDVFNILELRNESGTISAKVWPRKMHLMDGVELGSPIKVSGTVVEGFNGGPPELEVADLDLLPPDHPVRNSMNARCPIPLSALELRFDALVSLVRGKPYRAFLEKFFEVGCPKRDFIEAPAAIGHHHNYLHGLLEHTVEMTEIALEIAARPRFKDTVDRDYLISGCLIHDAGKAQEYQWRGVPIGMSWKGRFEDHIIIGPEMSRITWERAGEYLRKAGFTEETLILLQHIQVSHHREKEWGSPKAPATPEAYIAHLADKASADMRAVGDVISNHPIGPDGWIDRGKNSLYVPVLATLEREKASAAGSASQQVFMDLLGED